MPPKATVIVLNYNGKRFLGDCLDSLRAQSYPDLQVILVDNGSTDGSAAYVEERYAGFVEVVENVENRGFAGGNNAGLARARGKYVLLLNNDARADRNWVRELVRAAEGDERVGMCASKVLQYDDPGVIDTAGHLLYPDGLNRGRGRLEADRGQYDREEEVLFPSGSAALYRREMLEEIGYFDEEFFAYGDDTDLGLRGRLAGWRCLYVPGAVAYHRYSATAGSYSPLKAYLVERNRIWILLKYFPLGALLRSPFYTLVRLSLQAYGALGGVGAAGRFAREHSPWNLLGVFLRANWHAVLKSPAMWKKRRELRGLRRVGNREFRRWLKEYRIGARELSLKD